MQLVEIILLLNLGIVFSAPNHLKAVVLENNEIPAVSVGAGGVSASWGGYSAKAGLGGNTGVSGGLFASADSPHGNAAAGLGGKVGDSVSGGLGAFASSPYGGSAGAGLGGNANSATTYVKEVTIQGGSSAGSGATSGVETTGGSGSFASSGASTGGHTHVVYNSNNKPGGLFDNIFNIPISVLQAVNGYLNQQGGHVTKTVRVHGHGHSGPTIDNRSTLSQSSSSANADASTVYANQPAQEHHVPVAGTGEAVGSAGATVTVHKRPVNYDNIFNIPISALRAVNKLLNDGVASISKNIQVQGSARVSHSHAGNVNVAENHAGSAQVAHVYKAPSSIAVGAAVEGRVQVGQGIQVNSQVAEPHAMTSAAYTAQKPAGLYDNIFNIPITALRSVNQLLNG